MAMRPKADASKDDAVRFGGEFGPYRGARTKGVNLPTFKSLVWISNLGGLILVAIALELMVYERRFWWGLAAMIVGIAIAMFPSQYEIVDMGAPSAEAGDGDEAPAAADSGA